MTAHKQMILKLEPIRHQEVNSIAMGILPNGETYLSLNGLARFCGVSPSVIIDFSQEWTQGVAQGKPRGLKICNLICEWTEQDKVPISLCVEIVSKNSITGVIHAVPELICMAILDYYAHYADDKKDEALKNYRIAARYGLRKYIYEQLNYDETAILNQSWNLLRERILLNEKPAGYYTMFDEATGIIASLIRGGIKVDDSIMPDGSLGNHWGRYWSSNNFDNKYGRREKIQHRFPDSYRQLDPDVWAYPNSSLAEFRNWLENNYLPEKYPAYIKNRVKDGKVSADKMAVLISAVLPPSLENKQSKKTRL